MAPPCGDTQETSPGALVKWTCLLCHLYSHPRNWSCHCSRSHKSHCDRSLAAPPPTGEVLSMQVKPASSSCAYLYLQSGKRSSFRLLTSWQQTRWMAAGGWRALRHQPALHSHRPHCEGGAEAQTGRGLLRSADDGSTCICPKPPGSQPWAHPATPGSCDSSEGPPLLLPLTTLGGKTVCTLIFTSMVQVGQHSQRGKVTRPRSWLVPELESRCGILCPFH